MKTVAFSLAITLALNTYGFANSDAQQGSNQRLASDSTSVTDAKSGEVSTITYDKVERVTGGGLSRGAKIAIAVGVGAAAAIMLAVAASTLNHS
jgi:hypothetical protein